jgi:excisionase family DNA binding protein
MHSTVDRTISHPATAPDKFLSRTEVARLFNVSPSTVTRWADAGKLKCIRTLGGHRRYETHSVLELVRGLRKEESRLKSIDLTIPRMYGDHHTLAVQRTLLQMAGIDNYQANTAHRQVHIDFDEEALSEADILAQLESAGYPTHNSRQGIALDKSHPDPAWARTALRMTQTHPSTA